MAEVLDPRFVPSDRPCAQGHLDLRYVKNGRCVTCMRERLRLRALLHPERKVADNRKSYAKDAAARREYSRLYRAANPEKTRAAVRRWQARNAARIAATNKAWWRRNPEQVLNHKRLRRARKAAVESTLTPEQIEEITAAQRGRCAFCREKTRLTLDHIVPLSKLGPHTRANAQMLCRPCNSAKHDRDQIDFARSRGLLL